MDYILDNLIQIWLVICGLLVLNGFVQAARLAGRGKKQPARTKKPRDAKPPTPPAASAATVSVPTIQKPEPRKRGRPPKPRDDRPQKPAEKSSVVPKESTPRKTILPAQEFAWAQQASRPALSLSEFAAMVA